MDREVAEDGEAIQMMNTISPLKLKGSLTNSQFFSVFFRKACPRKEHTVPAVTRASCARMCVSALDSSYLLDLWFPMLQEKE